MKTMIMLSLIATNWGQELFMVVCIALVVGCVCAILGYFRDWLVSVFKIQAALDKLDEVKRKLDQMEKKIDDLKRH
jgi:uncharacterized membrane-anchored protein YhcB (DUF1043 family)